MEIQEIKNTFFRDEDNLWKKSDEAKKIMIITIMTLNDINMSKTWDKKKKKKKRHS